MTHFSNSSLWAKPHEWTTPATDTQKHSQTRLQTQLFIIYVSADGDKTTPADWQMTLGVWFETEDSRGGGSNEERESQLLAFFVSASICNVACGSEVVLRIHCRQQQWRTGRCLLSHTSRLSGCFGVGAWSKERRRGDSWDWFFVLCCKSFCIRFPVKSDLAEQNIKYCV